MRADNALGRAIVVAGCLIGGAILVHGETIKEPPKAHRPLAQLPAQIEDWVARPDRPLDRDTVSLLGVDDFVNRVYVSPSRGPIALYVGYYDNQREGDTIHSPLNCLPGAGWEPVARARAVLSVRDGPDASSTGHSIIVNRMVIEKGLDRELVLYWYQSHGRVVASEYWGRILLALDAIRLHRTDGALVRIIAPARDAHSGERSAEEFAQAAFPLLGSHLPR